MSAPRSAIYLDANAGAPLHPRVVEALQSCLAQSDLLLANPSSIHAHGRKAKRLLAEARESIAASFGATTDPEQLVFTSSGTEANQLAIRSLLEPRLDRGEPVHWITTPVEHDSVLKMVDWVKERGGSVSFLPVDSAGAPIVEAMDTLWTPQTALVSVVWVNNETGVITPGLQTLARQVRARGAALHIDAAQAWGKLPIDLAQIQASLVTFSAHKIGGLAGTGILWVGRGTSIHAALKGKQEKGRRAGTENLLGIFAAGVAATQVDPISYAARIAPTRDRLEAAIRARIPGAQMNGVTGDRVAGTCNLSFEGVEGDGMVMALDLKGYSLSSGSACASGVLEPSHVLMAMGKSRAQAMAAIRISLARELSDEVCDAFVEDLAQTTSRLQSAVANRASLQSGEVQL